MRLIEADKDREFTVKGFILKGHNENPGWKRKLISMGIVPGTKLKVLKKDDRNTILKLQNSRISICNCLAEKLDVE